MIASIAEWRLIGLLVRFRSVELGKQLALEIQKELDAGQTVTTHDASTNSLIAFALSNRKTW